MRCLGLMGEIWVFYCDVFIFSCVYLDQLKLCGLCVDGLGYVYVMSFLMRVMRTSCLCYMYVRMVVECGIFGILDLCVSFVSCIVMMSGCVLSARCFNSSILF